MKTVAFVPIRLNSKRVVGKNLKMLGDKPLMCYILDTLMKVKDSIPFTYQRFDREELKESGSENIFLKREPEENNNNNNINQNNQSIKDSGKKNKEELQRLLDQAVREERYEDAARYRDELDNLTE